MKRLLGVLGLILGLSAISHAGAPLDNGNTPVSVHSLITGSSVTANGAINVVLSSSTVAQAYSNCLDYFDVTMSTGATFTVSDGSTVIYSRDGTSNVLQSTSAAYGFFAKQSQHIEPLCGTRGNAMILQVTANGKASVNYEGFQSVGPGIN